MLRLTIATTLLAAASTVTSNPTSIGIAERSRSENFPRKEDYYGKEKYESENVEGLHPYEESSEDELADATGHRDVGYQDTGNSVNPAGSRQSNDDGWRDVVPGTPGMDYPNLDRIPVTSFTCVDKVPGGYYADAETGCQVFHVCNTGGVKSSFLCPPGSIFNQKYFVCDWWYGFNCDEAVDLYFNKSEQNLESPSDEDIYEKSDNGTAYDENFSTRENFDPLRGKYFEDATTPNDNPTNDLSGANSERGIVDYSSRENGRIDRLTHNSVANNVKIVSTKESKSRSNNEYVPRGFSRNDDESSKERKFDEPTISHELTNEIASYVNYFETGSNNNTNYNSNDSSDNDNNDKNSRDHRYDKIEAIKNSENHTSFGDKYVYGERTRSGYFSSDDPYESSERIVEDE